MGRLLRNIVFVFGIAMALAGDAATTPLPPSSESALLFPTRVGTKWVYATPSGERTEVITKAAPVGDDYRVTIESVEPDGRTGTPRVMLVGPKGVFVLDGYAVPSAELSVVAVAGHSLTTAESQAGAKSLWRMLPDANRVCSEWIGAATPVGGGVFWAKARVGRTERVAVPAGRYDATRIDWTFTQDYTRRETRESHWYAPGVGLVRLGDPTRWSLKSFTLGADTPKK